MSETIPEDIMAVASEICSQIAEFGAPAEPTIARAIMAERERCARIASRHDSYLDWGVIREDRNRIARAIRTPETAD